MQRNCESSNSAMPSKKANLSDKRMPIYNSSQKRCQKHQSNIINLKMITS